MSVDFQVIFPSQTVPLNNVRVITGPPRALEVTGADFRAVDEVLINDIVSPNVVISSKTQLVAEVPDFLAKEQILSVSVTSKRLTLSPRSRLKFQIGRTPGKVVGIMYLIQKFLKTLLTTPGKDIFNRSFGGGALKNISATFGHDAGTDVVSNLVVAVDTTSRQIVALQSRNPSIPLDERLLSAKILRAVFNREEGTLDVSIELNSQAGNSAITNLEL